MDDKIKETIDRVRDSYRPEVDARALAYECERLQATLDRRDVAAKAIQVGTARVAELERRLSQYECPKHPEPKFGECDECDKHDHSVEATPL